MIKIRVLFFGYLSELAERNDVILDLDNDARIADVAARLRRDYPQMEPMNRSIRFALNAEYCDDGAPLKDGDTVSLIPPVSGG